MFRILGSKRRLCAGHTRRDFMQIGSLGLFGVGLGDLLRLREAQAEGSLSGGPIGRAKACILLLPYGSPPQHETFDPKPNAPSGIRGEMGAIPTNVTGVQIGEYLPRIAQVMDRIAVVRSMTHPYPVHGVAYATSGIPTYNPSLERNPRDPRHWPYIGSVVDYVLGRRTSEPVPDIPRNLALPWRMNSRNGGVAPAGPYAAFLGAAYDPVVTDFDGEASRIVEKISPANGRSHRVADPYAGVRPNCRFRIAGTEWQSAMTLDRLNRRRTLIDQMDCARHRFEGSRQMRDLNRHQQMAFSMLTGTRLQTALDVQREPMRLRERYGMTLFGQACLAARRLVEAGGKFITVFWDEVGPINTDWDTHWNHFPRLRERLLPSFDLAFSALINDLNQRGLLDETLVVWMSEHGRTPRINNNRGGGRDHWSRAYSIALAGGGVQAGQALGASDHIAGDVVQNPVSPKDILATILYLLGIDPETTIPDRFGQPRRISGEGHVRTELF